MRTAAGEPDDRGADDAADDAPGLRCRRCGCRDLRVDWTRRRNGRILRRRICRHCGRPMHTREQELGAN